MGYSPSPPFLPYCDCNRGCVLLLKVTPVLWPLSYSYSSLWVPVAAPSPPFWPKGGDSSLLLLALALHHFLLVSLHTPRFHLWKLSIIQLSQLSQASAGTWTDTLIFAKESGPGKPHGRRGGRAGPRGKWLQKQGVWKLASTKNRCLKQNKTKTPRKNTHP